MKIVSLVPSITETLFDFGLTSAEVVGRTKFCIHPAPQIKEVRVIGGTKNLNPDAIKVLNPNLIIANKEENSKEQIAELQKDFEVWVTDIQNLADNEKFLTELGKLLNKKSIAEQFNEKIKSVFPKPSTSINAAYFIWQNPYMTVGNDTFIHEILKHLGFHNIFGSKTRYPEIQLTDLSKAELILLSTEPFPFKPSHVAQFKKKFPNKAVYLVDGEAFSWYGTHLANCESYFKDLHNRIRLDLL